MLACTLFVGGGSTSVMGMQLLVKHLTWAHSAIALGGLLALGFGMALSRNPGRL